MAPFSSNIAAKPVLAALLFILVLSSCTHRSQNTATNSVRRDSRKPPKSITIWETISEMKTSDKKPSPAIAEILGREIEIAGFIIVNEASSDELKEFLLTPISGGCIHVTPPPPNYIVKVLMPPMSHIKYIPGPVLLNGSLQLPKDSKDRKYYTLEFKAQQMGPFRATGEQ